MKPGQRLQWVWWACLGQVGLMGAICWWFVTQGRPPIIDALLGQVVTIGLLTATLVDLGLAVWIYRQGWLPLCESSLKRVWAGRLVNPAEARSVTQTLFGRSLLILVLALSPALYGVILAWLGAASPMVIGAFVGTSAVGLLVFYREGVQPAHDIFQHAARIAKG